MSTNSARGTINGLDANIVFRTIEAHTGSTTVQAKGNIVGPPKVTNLDITVISGRAQDLLRPFLHDEVPITGPVWLHSHAYLAPSEKGLKFLQRLYMVGTFDIPAERVTNQTTERNLSDFSQRAQDLKSTKLDAAPADQDSTAHSDVLSSLNGRAKISDGVVSTERLTFQIPGAAVDLHGSFNFRDTTVRLVGNRHMDSDVSHTTTGLKSVLIKLLIPFFQKDKAGAVIPIAVTGSKGAYKVAQDVLPRK